MSAPAQGGAAAYIGTMDLSTLTRRRALEIGAGLMALALLPRSAHATPAEVSDAIAASFGTGKPTEGRITLTVPPLAETGNSVPLAVSVDSPMTEADHVRRVGIFAEQNPRPKVAEMTFTPAAGAAVFDTKIRLAGTQDIVVVAEMSDGTLWSRRQKVMVVVGACTTLPARY